MKLIPLTKGKFAKVDDKDFEVFGKFKWYFGNDGYARRSQYNKITKKCDAVLLHREIMQTPKGMFTDHINMDRLDNTRKNLRVCSHKENDQNRKMRKDNKSGYIGVIWEKRYKKWWAYTHSGGKIKHIGYFEDIESAVKARDKHIKSLHGEFASLNLV